MYPAPRRRTPRHLPRVMFATSSIPPVRIGIPPPVIRRAAEDARLERFRADELPLPAARALSAFAGVAAAGQEFESGSVLSGIDILV